MTPQQLTEALARFTGTENYYRHWTNQLVFTNGVHYPAERAGACWLIDAIASYQHEPVIKRPRCRSSSYGGCRSPMIRAPG